MKTRKQGGFTLIELMIVVAIIAIIAAIAIPNLLSARLNANETSAISTLRNISSSQSQFQASSKADADNDGTGEFGLLAELSGRNVVRGSTSQLNPPVLSGAFRTFSSIGTVSRSGYIYRVLLPTASGVAFDSDAVGTIGYSGGATSIDDDLAETTWAANAWPANYGNSGNRTFFVNQAGDITSSDNASYTGTVGPNAHFPFVAGSAANQITGQVAVGTVGADGGMWRQVN